MKSGQTFSDAASIIDQHTILPYYLQLRSEVTRAAVVDMARTADLTQVKTWLGLLERRFNPFHPLKACAKCAAADLENHGVAYWHREHQLPAVWWCIEHDLPLGAAVANDRPSPQSTWQLPDDCEMAECTALQAPDRVQAAAGLRSIAAISAAWAGDDLLRRRGLSGIVAAYRKNFRDRGWITAGGALSVDEISASFKAFAAPLTAMPELAALPISRTHAIQRSVRMRRRVCARAHPLRHVVTIAWLFGDWQHFLAGVEASIRDQSDGNHPESGGDDEATLLKNDDLKLLIELIAVQDLAIAAASGADAARHDLVLRQRDQYLSEAISQVQAGYARRGLGSLTTTQLVKLVPELAVHLPALQLLPLTHIAIKRAGSTAQAKQHLLVA